MFGIVAVVVVPVEQRARRLGREPQRVHADHAAARPLRRRSNAGRSLIMLITVQGTTPKYSSIEVQHCTALMSTFVVLHPAVDHDAELRHLHERVVGNAVAWRRTGWMASSFRLHVGVVVLQPADAAEDLGEVERLDGDAVGFEQFLAVADGVERRRPRADGADAQLAQAVGDAADRGEPREVLRRTPANRALRCAAW